MRVGIAGIGKMGAAMAGRLQEAGLDVTVWNRSIDKAQATGLPTAESPRSLAQSCDVVITSLFDEAAAHAVFEGEDGLVEAAKGKLFIEMSTLRPESQRSLSKRVEAAGGSFIECPVGGTTAPARAGQLLGLVGGSDVNVERARPALIHLCRRIEHVGPVGAGALAKLAINLPLLVFWQSFGEALALAKGLGRDSHWLVDLFSQSAGAANVLKLKSADVISALDGNSDVQRSFDIDAMRKDLRMIQAEADHLGLEMPAAIGALAAFDEASLAGQGQSDCACAPAYWMKRQAPV